MASSGSVFTVEGVALFSDASSDFCDSCCSMELLYREGIEADTRLYPPTKRKKSTLFQGSLSSEMISMSPVLTVKAWPLIC